MIPRQSGRSGGHKPSDVWLGELQRDIDRARRTNTQLIAAYVGVDGRKVGGDSRGADGGGLPAHVGAVLRSDLGSYESVVRLGSDVLVCTFADTTIETVRRRFDQIVLKLNGALDPQTVTVGFAELARGDSPMDLVDRADRAQITARDAQIRGGRRGH